MSQEVMTGQAIHLLQEVKAEAAARAIHLLHHPPVEVVAVHQVAITLQVVVVHLVAAAILQVEVIAHQEVAGNI